MDSKEPTTLSDIHHVLTPSVPLPSLCKNIAPLLRHLLSKQALSPAWLKRIANDINQPQDTIFLSKPDGNIVDQLVSANPWVFASGINPLPPTDHPLNVTHMRLLHRSHCQLCANHSSKAHEISPSCYYSLLDRCITHGWTPPVNPDKVVPKYHTQGNYSSIAAFPTSVDKEINEMLRHGVLQPASGIGIVNPMGAQIKNSDLVRAKVLVHIKVHDQDSMDKASDALLRLGSSKIKCRMTLDPSATGVNNASPDAPFRYPSVHDMLDLVSKDCFLALTDIARYFHSFPLSIESRQFFMVEYQGQRYQYTRCPFGYKLCPYYCSSWSAEIKLWLSAAGITTAHMVDDWLTTASSREEAATLLAKIEELLTSVGFAISDKTKLGQREVLLGVMVDTSSMRIRFDPVQSDGVRRSLQSALHVIRQKGNPDQSLVRHLCGKLNWYAEALQSGRLHLASWWKYCKAGPRLGTTATARLIEDTEWWMNILQSWSEARDSEVSYRILSPSALFHAKDTIVILQSDASGTDGYGFFSSRLEESTAVYYSARWSDKEPPPSSSHAAELHALRSGLNWLIANQNPRPSFLIWVTDSMSSAYSVNKGFARSHQSFEIMHDILEQCDNQGITLVALWVPRELNAFADYLSHLAFLTCRSTVQGIVSLEDGFAVDTIR